MIGSPAPTDSRLRGLDPRTKIIGLGLMIWSVCSSTAPVTAALALGLVTAVAVGSGVGARLWFRPMWRFKWMFAAVLAMNLLFDAQGAAEGGGTYRAGLLVVQLAEMILLSVILGATTSAGELARGTMWFLRPLKRFGAPVDEWATALMLALRFIPLFNFELRTIVEAGKARGASVGRGGHLSRARKAAAALLPAFYGATRRSELLAEGLTARGFTPSGVMGRKSPEFRRTDYLAVAALCAAVGAIRLL